MSEPTINELFNLSGRVALITGASGYLGRAFANALAESGANVVVASRASSRAEQVTSELTTDRGNQHFSIALDQLDETSLNEGFNEAINTAGQIDIVVNNGHEGDAHDLTNVTGQQFNRQLSNATGYFLLARHLHDHVVERGGSGSVIMIGSMYGVVGSYPDAYDGVCPASPVHYHTLKGGIIHLTRHLAVYWAKDRVRVNCLSPGPFPSGKAPKQMVERLHEKSPMGRVGVPHELKGALLLLSSDAGSYITGQNLIVDGGWTAW